MTSLDQFQDNIKTEGGGEVTAFRMDNTEREKRIPDMRKYVGLGSCNCCDRFFVDRGEVFLVEETQLHGTIRNIKSQHSYLNSTDKRDFVITCIMQENYVKVYGSLLVLCRLVAINKDVERLVSGKKCNFWLVIEPDRDEESSIYFDHLKSNLLSDLRSKLSRKIVDEVEIIPSHIFAASLSKSATTS